jgi:hypothetical protein
MFIPFENIADEARVWIYQSNRILTSDEAKLISEETQPFIESWTAHNQQLHASFQLLENLFLVLGVDERNSQASGCSIDKSVHFIQYLEKKFNLSFTDRSKIAIMVNNQLTMVYFNEFKNQLKAGVHTENTSVFNTLAKTKKDTVENWMMKIEHSPYARFLEKVN